MLINDRDLDECKKGDLSWLQNILKEILQILVYT